jgi:radical SAM-linked protein
LIGLINMRLRITFAKFWPMQYVGHLDLHHSWERAFRRSSLPLEYSQGFHPQPHLNLACALPLGFTSDCEILDAWVEDVLPLPDIHQKLSHTLPPGLSILSINQVDDHAPSLQTQVLSAIYIISFLDDVPDLPDRLERVLSSEHLPRIRRGKQYDLRPLIENTALVNVAIGEKPKMVVQMAAREAATGRPEELLAEMEINFKDTLIHRQKLILISN